MEKDYSIFLGDIKTQILQSRYKAAAAVNRELIILYFQIGTRLFQKIEQAQWGSKVVQQLANDLQKEIKGLRGFSYRNLMNMRAFAEAYPILQSVTAEIEDTSIGQLMTGQIQATHNQDNVFSEFMQLATALFGGYNEFHKSVFLNVRFTQ